MIKKLLSLVALSATLIAPVLADDFVPLQYYETEPVYYLPKTIMSTTPTSERKKIFAFSSSSSESFLNGRDDEDECSIRWYIETDNTNEIEKIKKNLGVSSTITESAIDDILAEMRSGNTWQALQIFDRETTAICRES